MKVEDLKLRNIFCFEYDTNAFDIGNPYIKINDEECVDMIGETITKLPDEDRPVQLLTIEDLCETTGYSDSDMRRWIADINIKFIK